MERPEDFDLFAEWILSQPLPDKGDLAKNIDACVDEDGLDPHSYANALLLAARRQVVAVLREFEKAERTGEFPF